MATAQGTPDEVLPPIITDLTSRSFRVRWSPPERPNGIIVRYIVTQSSYAGQDLVHWSNVTSPSTLDFKYNGN